VLGLRKIFIVDVILIKNQQNLFNICLIFCRKFCKKYAKSLVKIRGVLAVKIAIIKSEGKKV